MRRGNPDIAIGLTALHARGALRRIYAKQVPVGGDSETLDKLVNLLGVLADGRPLRHQLDEYTFLARWATQTSVDVNELANQLRCANPETSQQEQEVVLGALKNLSSYCTIREARSSCKRSGRQLVRTGA